MPPPRRLRAPRTAACRAGLADSEGQHAPHLRHSVGPRAGAPGGRAPPASRWAGAHGGTDLRPAPRAHPEQNLRPAPRAPERPRPNGRSGSPSSRAATHRVQLARIAGCARLSCSIAFGNNGYSRARPQTSELQVPRRPGRYPDRSPSCCLAAQAGKAGGGRVIRGSLQSLGWQGHSGSLGRVADQRLAPHDPERPHPRRPGPGHDTRFTPTAGPRPGHAGPGSGTPELG